MSINLPPKVRFIIYVLVGVGGIIVTYLSTRGVIGEAELTAWSALSALVGGLAAFNTDTQEL
jgi:hypothetical protein